METLVKYIEFKRVEMRKYKLFSLFRAFLQLTMLFFLLLVDHQSRQFFYTRLSGQTIYLRQTTRPDHLSSTNDQDRPDLD